MDVKYLIPLWNLANEPTTEQLEDTQRFQQVSPDPADARGLERFADSAGASARTLAQLFRRETGMSFEARRRQLRLTEALALLAQGASPARAAAAVGYGSGPAFGAAFRAAFGTTPGRSRHAPSSL